MLRQSVTVNQHTESSLMAMNKVLRNTYLLLGMTFMFSALMAYVAVSLHVKPMHPLMMIIGVYGLMFLTSALQNSPMGLVAVFAFTGFMGYSIGPIIGFYIYAFSNGAQIVATALGGTGLIFFALSGYVLTTRKDFSYLNGFLFVGSIIGILAMIGGALFAMPVMSLVVSSIFLLIASGLIMMQTSAIIHGGETNYIAATVTLFVSIYNLFISLLNILSALSGRE